jgi:type II secretory pathway pseudopilin PulG
MSCASRIDLRRSRALTLVEILVATLVFLMLTASTAAVFIQVVRHSDEVDARLEAVSNARFFLDTLSDNLAQAMLTGAIQPIDLFNVVDAPLTFGDLRDNDGDVVFDEESPDGLDNDGDWQLARDDNDFSATVPTGGVGGLPDPLLISERGFQEADLGDGHVDEDVVFQNDTLSFWVPGPAGSNIDRQRLTYQIELFEGEDNVVVERRLIFYNDGTPSALEIGPLAFDVVSLSFLAWNHRTSPPQWDREWESLTVPAGNPPAPVSVYAEIIVHAESQPLTLPPTRAMQTIRLQTMVNIEAVLRSAEYPRGEDREEGMPL